MIKEAYVSFEVAKLLKEKGFNEYCLKNYWSSDKELHDWKWELSYNRNSDGNSNTKDCSAPTHQMAMAWLREIHNKYCDIGYDIDLDWFFQVIDLKETVENDYLETKRYHTEDETGFNTYEEALEAALKYVLENLI
jgi:hypothetical protein